MGAHVLPKGSVLGQRKQAAVPGRCPHMPLRAILSSPALHSGGHGMLIAGTGSTRFFQGTQRRPKYSHPEERWPQQAAHRPYGLPKAALGGWVLHHGKEPQCRPGLRSLRAGPTSIRQAAPTWLCANSQPRVRVSDHPTGRHTGRLRDAETPASLLTPAVWGDTVSEPAPCVYSRAAQARGSADSLSHPRAGLCEPRAPRRALGSLPRHPSSATLAPWLDTQRAEERGPYAQ